MSRIRFLFESQEGMGFLILPRIKNGSYLNGEEYGLEMAQLVHKKLLVVGGATSRVSGKPIENLIHF